MAVTTLRQMRQIPHTEIDDSFKSKLLGVAARPKFLKVFYGHVVVVVVVVTLVVVAVAVLVTVVVEEVLIVGTVMVIVVVDVLV